MGASNGLARMWNSGLAALTAKTDARREAERAEREVRKENLRAAADKLGQFAEGVKTLGGALAGLGHLDGAEADAVGDAAAAVAKAADALRSAAAR